MVGMTLEAVGCEAAVGGRCLIDTAEGKQIEAEVVGFSGDKLFLMPTGDIRGIMPGARVIPTRSVSSVAVGDELLGRVLDGAGRPLDGMGELRCADRVSLDRRAPESAAAACDPRSLGCGRALDQFAALGRRRTAHRLVRRVGRRQVGAARDDDALHQGGCDRGRPDRRARPRSAGFRQQYPGSRRHAPRRGGRDARRQSAAHAAARRVAGALPSPSISATGERKCCCCSIR